MQTIVAIGNGDGPRRSTAAFNWPSSIRFIYATIGIHPHEAKLADGCCLSRAGATGATSQGDCLGRDRARLLLRSLSARHAEAGIHPADGLARAAKLPIVIHCRPSDNSDNAWDDCLGLIEQHWAPSGLGGILHCFTGNWPHAKRALDMGFMISFAGNITFPKAQQIRDAALEVPLDRMLIETDSPFLAPVPHRGKRNEPAFVKEMARQTGRTARTFDGRSRRANRPQFLQFFQID